jgi:nitrite transporter NirC
MFSETITALADLGASKVKSQKKSLPAHFVRSMLAGMYVGAAIFLIFTIGGLMAPGAPWAVRMVMGICFGGALTIVIFAGSELFTGMNLMMTLGIFTGKSSWRELASNWWWTWWGNLAGSVLLAFMVVRTGLLDAAKFEPVNAFVLRIADAKMNLPAEQLFWRAVLANWLVCLGVWMNSRIKSEPARILMIWWCMFTFITCGFEHSIANMFGVMLGLLIPHGETITWTGYAYNIGLATLGNIVGGAFFVGCMYWMGSPAAREAAAEAKAERLAAPSANGTRVQMATATSADPQP